MLLLLFSSFLGVGVVGAKTRLVVWGEHEAAAFSASEFGVVVHCLVAADAEIVHNLGSSVNVSKLRAIRAQTFWNCTFGISKINAQTTTYDCDRFLADVVEMTAMKVEQQVWFQ